ncbi:hypothetical protein BDF14DRAFT_1754329 [Spinellus fusiger]|nr:hypothetical protein BDF14DRAFT_1754329 [Spinellus fusiger]
MFKSALSSFLNPNETTLKPLDEFQSTIKRNPHPLFIPVTSKTVNSNEQTALQPSSVSTPADKPYAFPLLTPQSTSKGWRLVLEEQPNKAYIPVLKYVSMLSRASSMIEDTPMKDANKNMSNTTPTTLYLPAVKERAQQTSHCGILFQHQMIEPIYHMELNILKITHQ